MSNYTLQINVASGNALDGATLLDLSAAGVSIDTTTDRTIAVDVPAGLDFGRLNPGEVVERQVAELAGRPLALVSATVVSSGGAYAGAGNTISRVTPSEGATEAVQQITDLADVTTLGNEVYGVTEIFPANHLLQFDTAVAGPHRIVLVFKPFEDADLSDGPPGGGGDGDCCLCTYAVGEDCPYSAPQDAIDAANAAGGGRVTLKQDTYVGNLTMRPNVHMEGWTTEGGNISGAVVIDGTVTFSGGNGEVASMSNLNIEPTAGHGIVCDGAGIPSLLGLSNVVVIVQDGVSDCLVLDGTGGGLPLIRGHEIDATINPAAAGQVCVRGLGALHQGDFWLCSFSNTNQDAVQTSSQVNLFYCRVSGDYNITGSNGASISYTEFAPADEINVNGAGVLILLAGTNVQLNNVAGGTFTGWDVDSTQNAMRGGSTALNDWNNANVGLNSFGWGSDTEVAGDFSGAFGEDIVETGDHNAVFGDTQDVNGSGNLCSGGSNFVTGAANAVSGVLNTCTGDSNAIAGNGHVITSDRVAVFGSFHVVDGENLLVTGVGVASAGVEPADNRAVSRSNIRSIENGPQTVINTRDGMTREWTLLLTAQTDDSTVEMTDDGAAPAGTTLPGSNRIILEDFCAYNGAAYITCKDDTGNQYGFFRAEFGCSRNSGVATVVLHHSAVAVQFRTSVNFTVAIAVDVVTGALEINVTSANDVGPMLWGCRLHMIETFLEENPP